jgi:hypothetical protein
MGRPRILDYYDRMDVRACAAQRQATALSRDPARGNCPSGTDGLWNGCVTFARAPKPSREIHSKRP